MRLLSRLWRPHRLTFTASLELPEPVAVIGDIHGCDKLLQRLLDTLDTTTPVRRIVCVGDYIDRGDRSAQVIDRLRVRPDILCLKGNHEAMCLDFLDDPERAGPRWLRNGGLQTLASYGVAGPTVDGTRPLGQVAEDLAHAMGPATLDWMRELPASWRTGNLLVTHAGADPGQPPEVQRTSDMVWGCDRFATDLRSDGIWVAHGHVIQDAPTAEKGRIGVDTGAYATGILTAAVLGDGPIRFLAA